MDLGGRWRAAEGETDLARRVGDLDLDETGWAEVSVPGQWRLEPSLATSDGPVLYRRRFEAPPGAAGERRWLVFDGIFYTADVWLDGLYLGDTEGYFSPNAFEVTNPLAAGGPHVLAVEVACQPLSDRRRKRMLTGAFQHWPALERDWNPGGIWAPVHLDRTGPARLRSLRVLCREAREERATLELEARLDVPEATTVELRTSVDQDGTTVAGGTERRPLGAGTTRITWRVTVDRPALWWPRSLGDQPLHDVTVEVAVAGGPVSDRRRLRTGLRQVRTRRLVTTINGERLFLKGADLGPTDRALATVDDARARRDVALAHDAGLDLLRVHAHVAHPAVYEEADRTGMLLWQDLPLQWGYGQVRRQALRQARQAVDLLGHHPAVILWCAHNEPYPVDPPPGGAPSRRERLRWMAGSALPGWNRTGLDGALRWALERADGSRPVLAHSGVLPSPVGSTDSHLWFGWRRGRSTDLAAALARWPALGRFVSEFGAAAVPPTDDFLHPERWPDLDWEQLEEHHALPTVLLDRVAPPRAFPSYAAWRVATQRHQADLVARQVADLRRLKYRPAGGFCVFLLADAQAAVSASLLDHRRRPKPAYDALREACRPVIVTADPLRRSLRPGATLRLGVHAVSDLRRAVEGAEVSARLRWSGGERRWRLGGDLPPDACVRVADLRARLPADARPGPLELEVTLRYTDPATGRPLEAHHRDAALVSVGPSGADRRNLRPIGAHRPHAEDPPAPGASPPLTGRSPDAE